MIKIRKVPHLDYESFLLGSMEDRTHFQKLFFQSLKDYGFVVLKNYGITEAELLKAYNSVKSFFSLDLEIKKNYFLNNGGQRGYTPYKVEQAKNSNVPDLKEFWHIGRENFTKADYASVYPSNIWPNEIKDFKNNLLFLYEKLDIISKNLLELIGNSFNLPANYFSNMIEDGNSILRLIHYPPLLNETSNEAVRSAAHEDINLITLLVGATDSGLQLLERDGTWLEIESNFNELVVDNGDMMSRITNNILPSTTHRVVNPKDSVSSRYSLPFFVHPHSNYLLQTIPSCKDPTKDSPDIKAHDFLIQRLKEIGLYK